MGWGRGWPQCSSTRAASTSAAPLACGRRNKTRKALTYARRYGLQAVLGITADDDDDGNHASKPQQQRPQAAPQQQTRKPLWDDDDAFFQRLQQSGRSWPKVVAWLNEKHGGKYKPDAGFWDVSPEHRKAAVEAMASAK